MMRVLLHVRHRLRCLLRGCCLRVLLQLISDRSRVLRAMRYGCHERWSYRRYGWRTSDPDALSRSLCGLHRGASRDTRGVHDGRDGTSTSGDDDGMRSSDASTSHATSSDGCTTSEDNIPSTKASTTLPKLRSRTNRILPDGKRKQAL